MSDDDAELLSELRGINASEDRLVAELGTISMQSNNSRRSSTDRHGHRMSNSSPRTPPRPASSDVATASPSLTRDPSPQSVGSGTPGSSGKPWKSRVTSALFRRRSKNKEKPGTHRDMNDSPCSQDYSLPNDEITANDSNNHTDDDMENMSSTQPPPPRVLSATMGNANASVIRPHPISSVGYPDTLVDENVEAILEPLEGCNSSQRASGGGFADQAPEQSIPFAASPSLDLPHLRDELDPIERMRPPEERTSLAGETNEDEQFLPPEFIKGGKMETVSSFRGERGGAAEDEDLLAMLRAVSAKSGASSRFGDEEVTDEVDPMNTTHSEGPTELSEKSPGSAISTNPDAERNWSNDKVEQLREAAIHEPALGIRSSSNYKGERGGTAEDEELLALLRGVSAKSGAASRFAEDDNDGLTPSEPAEAAPLDLPATTTSSSRSKKANDADKPWKRKGGPKGTKLVEADVMVAEPPSTVNSPHEPSPLASDEGPPVPHMAQPSASTFKGERGGEAQDAELLALLRGVSAKSGASSRFADKDTGDFPGDTITERSEPEYVNADSPQELAIGQDIGSDSRIEETKPWKRGNRQNASSGHVVSNQSDTASSHGIQKDITDIDAVQPSNSDRNDELDTEPTQIASTYSGDRGGAAQDEELLALLRGVSAKSGASSRFADEETNKNDMEPELLPSIHFTQDREKVEQSKPWKSEGRKNMPAAQDDVVVVTAPGDSVDVTHSSHKSVSDKQLGGEQGTSFTFKGERGGDAQDEELLALLRGVSTKSGASSRFADDDVVSDLTEPRPSQARSADGVRPETSPVHTTAFKAALDDGNHQSEMLAIDPTLASDDSFGTPAMPTTARANAPVASTFRGERGGDAQDAELLALLRGVSATSGASSRFAEEELDTHSSHDNMTRAQKSGVSESGKSQRSGNQNVSFSKRLSSENSSEKVENEVAVPVDDEPVSQQSLGIKSEIPSAFNGERGGSAEDEELLALLRGVSAKSGASRRFEEGSVTEATDAGRSPPRPTSSKNGPADGNTKREPATVSKKQSAPGKPWKTRGLGNKGGTEVADVVLSAPAPSLAVSSSRLSSSDGSNVEGTESSGYGIKSEVSSTFIGERGGSAQDEELLALLRGVSAKSGAANRFADQDVGYTSEANVDSLENPVKHVAASAPAPLPRIQDSCPAPLQAVAPRAADSDGDVVIKREDLPSSLFSKDWKTRLKAYGLLCSIIEDSSRGNTGSSIDSNGVYEGLDEIVAQVLEDTQVAALDKALELAILYAENCTGAGLPEHVCKIVSTLVQKNALCSRPSTLKLAAALSLTLMEVGTSGTSSVHTAIEVFIKEGLTSKKPKVVQACANLIFESMLDFGASNLPLPILITSLPKMLGHTNAAVRESGLNIVAELCRVLGSKAAIQDVIDSMKKAQVQQLDSLLTDQADPTPPRRGFRNRKKVSNTESGAVDTPVSVSLRAEDLEAQRFAARPAVDLLAAVAKTDYSKRLENAKWSEKVAALDVVLECAGEKPFKLVPPSSAVNYVSLIGDSKKLLAHTHFAVCNKAMEVLSMLAQGVGEKLFPHLRPLLTQLLQLSKDKKLTRGVASCLDAFFGNILGFQHLLEDDGLPISLDEKKERNALARTSAMEFLGRCVLRSGSAGLRGQLGAEHAGGVATLCVSKLDDSDASVRKASLAVLQELQRCKDPKVTASVGSVIELLKTSNARAYKTLAATVTNDETTKTPVPASGVPVARANEMIAQPTKVPDAALISSNVPPKKQVKAPSMPRLEEATKSSPEPEGYAGALEFVTGLCLPAWDAAEDDGGILTGLRSSKWLLRQNSIKALGSFIESGDIDVFSKNVDGVSSSILLIVKEHTRGFKETNVNILKAIFQLFMIMIQYHESKEVALCAWAMRDGVELSLQKISDKKLSKLCKDLLTELCVVYAPSSAMSAAIAVLGSIKSPIAHEEFLQWAQSFCGDFGASVLGSEVTSLLPWLLQEIESSNPKVRKEALCLSGMLFSQLGPKFKAVFLSLVKTPETKSSLEKCFEEAGFDPGQSFLARRKQPLAIIFGEATEASGQASLELEIPKTDIIAQLDSDIISRLNSKDGKTAWKQRKEALDEIERVLLGCSGLIASDPQQRKRLSELCRGLRDRLVDTQINLRPLAAKVIGNLLARVDKSNQAKLGKVVYAALIHGAMNDIKKPMRDACLDALQKGTLISSIEQGGLNAESVEAFATALVSEVNESSVRACGLPEVLLFLSGMAATAPNFDAISTGTGQLSAEFATMIIECLTSSKSETRSAAASLLESSIKHNVISPESLRRATERLIPAKQRSVAPLVAKFTSTVNASSLEIPKMSTNGSAKEVLEATKLSEVSKGRKGPLPQVGSKPVIPKSLDPRKSEKLLADRHPLASRSALTQPLSRGLVWPEYPEEPQGSSLYGNLRKAWSHSLPVDSLSALFPAAGIRKQDEAKAGCELLQVAIEADRTNGRAFIIEQSDVIMKWLAYALCSRETTVGLQAILSLTKELFSYLIERKHELSDSAALEFIPYFLEKASNSKGRFRDMFIEVFTLMRAEEILPIKRFGSVVCVAVIERSSHAKARVASYQYCQECIEACGLNGCGKRGVLAAAKSLSEEKVPENRIAALDLMEIILSRMNGDLPRLSRICGPNLSAKALQLLQERWQKRDVKAAKLSNGPVELAPKASHIKLEENEMSGLFDELPALSLRNDTNKTFQESGTRSLLVDLDEAASKVFAFSRPDMNIATTATADKVHETEDLGIAKADGAAASLRMRLLNIREKSKPLDEIQRAEEAASTIPAHEDTTAIFEKEMNTIRSLLTKRGPLSEDDPHLQAGIDALKRFHAALSKQNNISIGLSTDEVHVLRECIAQQLNAAIEQLTRLIGYAFNCCVEGVNSGMSIPLLSVCLATLMALFRDQDLAANVSQDNLTLLIRETGAALLDPRLSSSTDLDEGTASQMVRAINKLAVQAATGATRHSALLALMALQQQLSQSVPETAEEEAFNNRLSRVVSKLFSRVVKAEENVKVAYRSADFDMEALVCWMDDLLVFCDEMTATSGHRPPELVAACRDMVNVLLLSIIKVHEGPDPLLKHLDDLEIDRRSSALGMAIDAVVEHEYGGPANIPVPVVSIEEPEPASSSPFFSPSTKGSSRDVASLVSALGSAPEGPARDAALKALRTHTDTYGDAELRAHLQQISSPFRAFIETQLEEKRDSPLKHTAEHSGTSMSERLRSLRSRLEVTERTVQTAGDEGPFTPAGQTTTIATSVAPKPTPNSPTHRSSRLIQPSPSRLPSALPVASTTSSSSSQSLRERLAMAQENRKTGGNVSGTQGPAGVGTSMGRAAALRARLEAVKKGKTG